MGNTEQRNGLLLAACIGILFLAGCSSSRKLAMLQSKDELADISIPEREMHIDTSRNISEDTIKIEIDGREMILMKAVRDAESGEMVAHQELQAAFVTARYRSVAERRGKADLEFQIRVPEYMLDTRWQLRFYPSMFVGEETHVLEPVFITGSEYRKIQLRGYQQYQRFLNSIITDSVDFINRHQLDIFLKRNIPQIYAYKDRDAVVSDEEFFSHYGVTERMAIEHYTIQARIRRNDRKIGRKEEVFRRYVKSPIITSGLRLDSLYRDKGEFIYTYVQPIDISRDMRRVDVVLNGDIYEETDRIYGIPYTEPLSFYVSSLSSIVDDTPRYRKVVVERKVSTEMSGYLDFEAGRSDVMPGLASNASEISRLKGVLRGLLEDGELELDSVYVTAFASPEGSVSANRRLSAQRANAVGAYFKSTLTQMADSMRTEAGFSVDADGDIVHAYEKVPQIMFRSCNGGEDWERFTRLVNGDAKLEKRHKDFYAQCMKLANLDSREEAIKSSKTFYRYCREIIYPKLRHVRFDFHLHRRGMVQDTVHTSVIDSVYVKGVQAIRDREYEKAVSLLAPYKDYNTAVAYVSLDRNSSALEILQGLEKTAKVNYMLAIVHSRFGDTKEAIRCYMESCRQDKAFVSRGYLDPEISRLISMYELDNFNISDE